MQSTPSESGRVASRADSPGHSTGGTVRPGREQGLVGEAGGRSTPALVLRPRIQWWLPGPALLVVAIAIVASGRWLGLALMLIAVPLFPVLWVRLEVGEQAIRRRTWRGTWSTIPMGSVDALRLRRLPFGVLRWMRRGYRIGRFWSVPLTLRLQRDVEVLIQLRCVWWSGWKDLARFVGSLPEVDLDVRTRGRLDRYVGPIASATPVQP